MHSFRPARTTEEPLNKNRNVRTGKNMSTNSLPRSNKKGTTAVVIPELPSYILCARVSFTAVSGMV